ncbi:MAG: type II secretion system protein [Bacilli bacterium]|nr:type II secretion system protein [Bacilli bacterium]
MNIKNCRSKFDSMKKGFTLVELLAVIVILAVIALVAVPSIMGIISKAQIGAIESSALGYMDAVEKASILGELNNGIDLVPGTYLVADINDNIKVKGQKPTSGVIVINEKGVIEVGSLCINNKKIDYSYNKATYDKYNNCDAINIDLALNNYDDAKNVNKPILSTGMTPVKWDASNNEIETTVNDPEWYDYANKKWANVKTADGSYFVWIPRYAYKITSGYHSSTTGSVEIKFLKGTTNITEDKTQILSSGYEAGVKDTSMYYFTHPSFQNEINGYGYWVAKYEATASEGVVNGYTSDGSCPTVGDNVTTKTVKIIPNATSWRCINNKNIYNLTLDMKNKATYGWLASEVDTHAMTNLEWGAATYLSKSIYGANDEIWINNANNYTTGCAGSSASATASTTGCQNAYNTTNGVKASTTYNITGIYDMSGGAWDKTMAVYNNLGASSGFTNAEVAAMPSKYITRYETLAANLLNNVGMDYDKKIYGDAIYETSGAVNRYNGASWVGTSQGAWYTDNSYMPYVSSPWIHRGGYFINAAGAGVFDFCYTHGYSGSNLSFRPVVSVAS